MHSARGGRFRCPLPRLHVQQPVVGVLEPAGFVSGLEGRRLTQLSLIGPFFNVPYRVLLSAAVVALVTDTLQLVTI